jgi:hypothetical protein
MLMALHQTPPSGLPAISPARGEISSFEVGDLLISPLAGEMAGRPEGGAKERTPRRKALLAPKRRHA